MKYFRKLVEQYISVNDKEWSLACDRFNKVSVKKGTIVHLAGNVFSDIWFIKSGLARSYFTDINGRELTWQLYFRPIFFRRNNGGYAFRSYIHW